MFKRIWTLVIKEFLAVFLDRKTRTILILPPLLQLFVFSYAATLDVKNVTLGILNRDSGKYSFELIQRFKGSPTFTHLVYLDNEQQIQTFIDTQKGSAVLHFDALFSQKLLSTKPSPVQMILDGRKSNTTQIVLGYANQIVDQFNKDLVVKYHLPQPSSVVITRNWFNPNLIYSWFTVPGLVGTLAMLTSLLVTAMTVARERELGTFDQLLVSPLLPLDILIGKAIPGVIVGMAQATLMILAAVFIFKIPLIGSIAMLYLGLLFFIISIVGIGLFLSSLSKTQQQALLYAFVFIAPAIILSGFATPIENMPVWLQKVSVVNPLSHFLIISRGIFLKEMTAKMVWSHTYPLILIGLFTLCTASWFFKKRIQ